MLEKLLFIFGLVVLGVFACCFNTQATEPEEAISGTSFVNTDNYANRTLSFYYYIPQEVIKKRQNACPVLVCVPGLSGDGKQFVNNVFKNFAHKEKFVIIAPSFKFDEENFQSNSSYQYPSAWSGKALLKIIEKVERQNYITLSKIYLFGFSAGAQFSSRFALLWPERCRACAVHAAGGYTMPERKIDVIFFVTVCRGDSRRLSKAEKFYDTARRLGIKCDYKEYPGSHELPNQQTYDSLAFFRKLN
ncbi:MAG: alpha/beta fold hydrolase [Candidatus Omnitrophota bacterium]